MTYSGRHETKADATQLFVANFQNSRYEDLPPEVVRVTKNQVLDFLGVALGGSGEAGVAEVHGVVDVSGAAINQMAVRLVQTG